LAVASSGCSSKSSTPTTSDGGTSTPSGWKAAVGAGGTLVQTFDDATWTTRSVMAVDLFGVTCVGALKGWASGANGTIAHTEDGGKTWGTQTSHVSASLRAIHFGDANLGVVAGDAGALAFTNDGGATWSPVTLTTKGFYGVAVASDIGALY